MLDNNQKKWINKKLKEKYPGAKVVWGRGGKAEIVIRVTQEGIMSEIIEYVVELHSWLGEEYEFYPEQVIRK